MDFSLFKTLYPHSPLTIQQEIVTILDTFTALDGSLQAELEARRKQYEHYRNQLLNFEGKENYVELKDLAEFSQGIQVDLTKQYTLQKEDYVRFLRIVDFVNENEVPRYIENPGFRYMKKEGDLIMIRYGASAAGKVFLKFDGAIANNMFQIKIKTKELNIKFLYYFLTQSSIYQYLNSSGGASTMPAITFSQVGSLKIPIPPLSEQERIVSILDKFDALVNTELPAEIAARRKQYEYYREKLLDFKTLQT